MDHQYFNLKRKVDHYKEIKENTLLYRRQWKESLRDMIVRMLEQTCQEVGLEAKTEVRSDMENLETVVLSLGDVRSGLYQVLGDDLQRDLVKHNGSLIYQQLFNGKVLVLIHYPFIEGYGQQRPPKTVGIYRPEELHPPFFIRHMEDMMHEVTAWEDYDDDEPTNRIGFNMSYTGNNKQELPSIEKE